MDLKFAFRSLFKSPGFTLLAIVVMALGIGANTAVFSVVNAVLLKPLDGPEPDRIVTLASLARQTGSHYQVSAPDFHDWHDQSTAFIAMAYYTNGETAVSTGRTADYANVASITPEFLRVFAVEPVVGRFFSAEEVKRGGPRAVLISSSFWRAHFAGKPDALGQTIRLFDNNFTIVGVLPTGFHFPDKTDIWFPANTIFEETSSRSGHNYLVVAR